MPTQKYHDAEDEASVPLQSRHSEESRRSEDSSNTDSTTSLVLERLNPSGHALGLRNDEVKYTDGNDIEAGERTSEKVDKPMERKVRKLVWIIGGGLVGFWLLAMAIYATREHYRIDEVVHDPDAQVTLKAGKKIDMDQIMYGRWRAHHQSISWIASADGKTDGLMLQENTGEGYLVVKPVIAQENYTVLMEAQSFTSGGKQYSAARVKPSPDLSKVLLLTDYESNFRHSYFGHYFIYDVKTKKAEPLWPGRETLKAALAVWSPDSKSVAFVFENNIYVRKLQGDAPITTVTTDGGTEIFNGVPDWVYEEEVFAGNSVLWWSEDSKYFAFVRTDETKVPEYPVQYFASRPSGNDPVDGLENYPEERLIKYPKAGAPNPVVTIKFYDIEKAEVFSVDIEKDFKDLDRLITEVVWAGPANVLIRETDRDSSVLKMVLVDVTKRTGKTVREIDAKAVDGGWFEVTEDTKYIPADPAKGRPYDGYIDTVVNDGWDHLAYFTPLDSPEPILLTSGEWEVVDSPSAIDLDAGLVYFRSTERSPIQRHYYSVKLDGTDKKPLTNDTADAYISASFSAQGGYALVSYDGPSIPWQKVISTHGKEKTYEQIVETNDKLKEMVSQYELPTFHYSTVTIDGFELQVLERRPPHFNSKLKYPVIFHVYGGPGSQTVTKEFKIDFQGFLAAGLGYIVVTVDGRGTGFIGRKARVLVRGDLGHWESHDQIETAKIWAKKPYVDSKRIAIWGWSYGGYMTLKTLEQDGGRTFSYGMAVAPVTDWLFYDSIYTERYMHTPQNNPGGYASAAINNVTALGSNVRFLFMHGVADDNVHFQNSLTLLDKLDLGGIENYDVHVFPDSDHSIYFHNANRMVYDRLVRWLILAFNGEFVRMEDEKPKSNEKEITD